MGSLVFARQPGRWVDSLARTLGEYRILWLIHYAEDVALPEMQVPRIARLTIQIRPAKIELVARTPLESGWVQILQKLEAALGLACIDSVLTTMCYVRWLLQRSAFLDSVGRNDWNPDEVNLLRSGMWR